MSWSRYSVITPGPRLTRERSTWLEQHQDDVRFRLGRTFFGVFVHGSINIDIAKEYFALLYSYLIPLVPCG